MCSLFFATFCIQRRNLSTPDTLYNEYYHFYSPREKQFAFFSSQFCYRIGLLTKSFLLPHSLTDAVYVKALLTNLSNVHQRIMKSHQNIQTILQSIQSLCEAVLFHIRRSNVNNEHEKIEQTKIKYQIQSVHVDNLNRLIASMMNENFQLLFHLTLCKQIEQSANVVSSIRPILLDQTTHSVCSIEVIVADYRATCRTPSCLAEK